MDSLAPAWLKPRPGKEDGCYDETMPAGDPKTPPVYRYRELPPPDFEGLVFRTAWVEDRRVVRVRAPDGGLDTIVPDASRAGKAERGWQAKRHAVSIDWEDCAHGDPR
jgi:hypothetical protein